MVPFNMLEPGLGSLPIKLSNLVIPAKAGIHSSIGILARSEMGPRLRGEDIDYTTELTCRPDN
ncbi:hypothetical protein B1207_08945 [Legionella quinlivanii]|uniref:Uncharacterized protein n=1 Tax=Legionella quinlivanii TaxID=45073 RepID=A0A364LIR0_9GAMM|nr:hypothetical protein B1207_08945 [Legionella quinlivanii]